MRPPNSPISTGGTSFAVTVPSVRLFARSKTVPRSGFAKSRLTSGCANRRRLGSMVRPTTLRTSILPVVAAVIKAMRYSVIRSMASVVASSSLSIFPICRCNSATIASCSSSGGSGTLISAYFSALKFWIVDSEKTNRPTNQAVNPAEARFAGMEEEAYKIQVVKSDLLVGTYWMAKDRLHVMMRYESADGSQKYELKSIDRVNYWTIRNEK